MDMSDISGYAYADSKLNHSHSYLLPTVFRLLDGLNVPADQRRLFELGCGNGSVAHELTRRGWDVTGVDPSAEGIAQANCAHPDLKLHTGSAYDDLAACYGQFPVVLSLEVAEHVYFPRQYASTVFSLLQRGGTAILSTPYHGYWKNSGAGDYWQDGCAPHRAVGSRPYQVLVDKNTRPPARRGRLPGYPFRAGRAHSRAGQVHDRGGAKAEVMARMNRHGHRIGFGSRISRLF
jgi:SAM-dependent methyltransferase